MYSMKALVVYYSRDGHTKEVAEKIAKNCDADIEFLVENEVDRDGIAGWLRAGYDGFKKNKSTIGNRKYECSQYDRIYIGSPVWAGNIAPAIRTFLEEENLRGKEIKLFGTMDGAGAKKMFDDMKTYLKESKIMGEMMILSKKVKSSDEEINRFTRM